VNSYVVGSREPTVAASALALAAGSAPPHMAESVNAPLSAQSRSSRCALSDPRLYIYELPESYQDPGGHRDNVMSSLGTAFPNASAELPGFPRGSSLLSTGQFALGAILYQRALFYRCRTYDPAAADLFFVPAFSARMARRSTEYCMDDAKNGSGHQSLLYERLRAVRQGGEPILARYGGADHLLVNPRNGAAYESRPT
jgi:hypothetical protein